MNKSTSQFLFYFVFIYENTIFLVGGGQGNGIEVQKINFDGVTNIHEAKSKEWVMIGKLNHYTVHLAGVELYDSKLFVLGRHAGYGYRYENTACLQIFDLSTNTTHSLEAKILSDKIRKSFDNTKNVNVF